MPPADPTIPIDVLIVASWFPAYDDQAAGRFVADQAEALATSGLVRPLVVSFDASRLSGGATSRGRQAMVVQQAAVTAARTADPIFQAQAWGIAASVPVARLTIAEGSTPAAGATHAAVHREAVLTALGDRLAAASHLNGRSHGIVHAHTAYPDGVAAIALADHLGWPLFITEHSSFVERTIGEPLLRERYVAALARCHKLYAVSEMLADELREAFPEHASRIHVLPNAVPVELFRAAPLEARAHDQLLFVGYRKESKGIENLLRAVAVAYALRPTVSLRLLGRSPDEATEERWRALAGELGITAAVRFGEAVDRASVAASMARASVFVHPSPRETFGVVAVEALASGTPVVATDSGGVTEILGPEPEKLGALVPVDDPEALGQAIVATLERRDEFDPLELRASVERRFGAAYVSERLLVEYREALAGDGSESVAEAGAAEALDEVAGEVESGPADADGPIGPEVPVRLAIGPTTPHPEPTKTIVVALDRERAALRLGTMAQRVRAPLFVLTAVQPSTVELPEGLQLFEVAVDPSWRLPPNAPGKGRRGPLGRITRLVTDPVGTVRRRTGHDAGSEASVAPATEALRRLVQRLATPSSGRVVILPLDGHDYLAAAPVLAEGVARPAPGGLRYFADAWRALGRS